MEQVKWDEISKSVFSLSFSSSFSYILSPANFRYNNPALNGKL